MRPELARVRFSGGIIDSYRRGGSHWWCSETQAACLTYNMRMSKSWPSSKHLLFSTGSQLTVHCSQRSEAVGTLHSCSHSDVFTNDDRVQRSQRPVSRPVQLGSTQCGAAAISVQCKTVQRSRYRVALHRYGEICLLIRVVK
jgi:hypothetical protein